MSAWRLLHGYAVCSAVLDQLGSPGMGWLSLAGSLPLPPLSPAAGHSHCAARAEELGGDVSPRDNRDSLTCATESWGCHYN